MLDGFIIMAIIVPIQLMTGFTERVTTGDVTVMEQLAMALLGMGAFLIPNGYPLFTRGQSIGKLADGDPNR